MSWISFFQIFVGFVAGIAPLVSFIFDQGSRFPFKAANFIGWFRRKFIKARYFVAIPMASLGNDPTLYQDIRERALHIDAALRKRKGFFPLFVDIYCAILDSKSEKEFDPPAIAAEENVKRIKRCDYFMLIYSHSIPTSALVEIGIAIAFEKYCIIFNKSDVKLPFMLSKIGEAVIPGQSIRIFPYDTFDEINQSVERYGNSLFRNN